MTEPASPQLLRLMTWLSPAFPVGAFSYSHGIEQAIHDGAIVDRETLVAWLSELIRRGSAWNDAVLLAETWRNGDSIDEVAALAEAMAGSRERHMETMLQGEAFVSAMQDWVGDDDLSAQATERHAYPIAVGQAAASHGIALEPALVAYLNAFVSNLVQAAVRLVPLGQRAGVGAMAGLEPVILETASRAAASTLDDLGSATFMSEIMTMKHETLYSRVFRS
jgi:urease accessory protein